MEEEIFVSKFSSLIEGFFELLYVFSLIFVVFYIIYLGIIYITQKGEGAKKVHQSIPYLLIGIFLIFLSVAIPQLIKSLFVEKGSG